MQITTVRGSLKQSSLHGPDGRYVIDRRRQPFLPEQPGERVPCLRAVIGRKPGGECLLKGPAGSPSATKALATEYTQLRRQFGSVGVR